jgi:hypothetical protein
VKTVPSLFNFLAVVPSGVNPTPASQYMPKIVIEWKYKWKISTIQHNDWHIRGSKLC